VSTQTVHPTTVTLAAGADVLGVLVFAAVGRSSHAEAPDAVGVLTTAAPFLFGLLLSWLVVRVWRAPLRLPVGVAVWAGVVIVGLGVRASFTHRLPLTFVLIAAASLAVLLLGWRAVAHPHRAKSPVTLPGRGSNSITGLYSCHRSGLRRCCRYSDDSLVSMDAVSVRYEE
jgi:peptidoglycan/LPS O-acetylase OafA/YrhL